jgi:predicted ferric reductase
MLASSRHRRFDCDVTTTVSPPTTNSPVGPLRSRGRTTDHAWIVGVAGAVGALVMLGMWIRHGALDTTSGPGGAATAAGQLAALLGTYAVLGELLLMSRIAWLERAIGLDRLAVVHRWNGFALVWLLSAHVVLTTVGWAAGSIPRVSIWHETTWLISHGADVLMAWVGFALFIAIAVTSVRVARKKLRRQTWYSVHLYAYIAVALSFAHQLAVGSDFTHDRAARIYWISLYVVVFGSILWWRVIEPVRLNMRHSLRVHSVRREGPGVISIYLSGRNLERIGAQAGQFFLWRFVTPSGWWQAHPFSLSAAPTSTRLRITVKSLGDYTSSLARIKRGTRVFAEGPYGTFTGDRRTSRRALLIAGGIGITPLRALLETFGPDDDVVLCYRVQHSEDAIFSEELERFATERGMRIHIIPGTVIGDDQTDLLGVPALRRGVPDLTTRDCFVCGPPGLVDAVCRRLRKLHVPGKQIHFERFEL